MRKSLVFILIVGVLVTGCSVPGFGKRVSAPEGTPTIVSAPAMEATPAVATPAPTATTAQETLPTATTVSLIGEQPTTNTVSLLSGPAPTPDASSALPTPDSAGGEVVRQTRYSTPRFSFEPAAGWQMDEINSDTLLIHLTGDDAIYTGATNQSPYIYLQYTDNITPGTRLVDVLSDMRETFAGAEIAEDAAMPIIDGLRGVGQFIEGQNDVTGYRAYLMVFPLRNGVLKGVFWSKKSEWRTIAPQLSAVLASLRFPQI